MDGANGIGSESGINILNESGKSINEKSYYNYVVKVMEVMGLSRRSIGILFTNNDVIQGYNKKYRNKDKATDVLSFIDEDEDDDYLGDIIISLEWVEKEYSAEERERQTKLLIIHSMLHLTGVHHSYEGQSLKENHEKMEEIYLKIEEG